MPEAGSHYKPEGIARQRDYSPKELHGKFAAEFGGWSRCFWRDFFAGFFTTFAGDFFTTFSWEIFLTVLQKLRLLVKYLPFKEAMKVST